MSAYKIRSGAGISGLQLVDIPTRALMPHEVRVSVHAVSLNYRDLMVADNTYPVSTDQPLVPGSDAAGEVTEVGASVTRFKVGDRVLTVFFPNWIDGAPGSEKTAGALGAGDDGVLAEELIAHEQALVKIPAQLDYIAASTITCAGLTAWNTLFCAAALKPGATVLLLGTGGVSIWALQLAKAAGLRSIITSSSDEKLARARELGAFATINYRTTPDWQDEVLRLTEGRGVDLVLEVGGTDTLARSVNSTRIGGSVAIIGGVSGFGGEFQPFALIGSSRKLLGIFVGNRAQLEELVQFVEFAGISPIVDKIFPFDQAQAAYQHLKSGKHFGKVVIKVRG
ncbi:MAG: NAD(P)-dependent alcohol dehydrogenase [Pseudomonadota bacterium]